VDAQALVEGETKGSRVAMAVEPTGNFPAVLHTIEHTLGIGGNAITRPFPLPELVGAVEETMTRRDGTFLVKPELN
jgi:hypothetical protein